MPSFFFLDYLIKRIIQLLLGFTFYRETGKSVIVNLNLHCLSFQNVYASDDRILCSVYWSGWLLFFPVHQGVVSYGTLFEALFGESGASCSMDLRRFEILLRARCSILRFLEHRHRWNSGHNVPPPILKFFTVCLRKSFTKIAPQNVERFVSSFLHVFLSPVNISYSN